MSRLLRTAVISAVALFGAGASASAAQAVVIDSDNVKITTTGYDFGGYDWAAGVPIGTFADPVTIVPAMTPAVW